MQSVVTRFPPSPTGYLHIGGARTALFNWLLARQSKGRFILRIEDTDTSRSSREMTDSILQAMEWLGLDWDAGPFYQSERFDLYHSHIEHLLDSGLAYSCSCTPEEVEAMREEAKAKGKKPKYDGRCRERGLGPGPGRVVRFKSPLHGQTVYQDEVKGSIAVDNTELDDFILRRADGTPTYNLAVVVDDADMEISHILRGDDHMSNTPKQVLLYQALGFAEPVFGHVPMILGPDKKRLSKRHGAMSVLQYEELGYLPEALSNYLVRLGWSFGDQEIFSMEELVEKFSMGQIGKSACVFNAEKLDWVNHQHIQRAEPRDLAGRLPRYLRQAGLPDGDVGYLAKVVPLLQPRAGTLVEMVRWAEPFVREAESLSYDQGLLEKFLTEEVQGHLQAVAERLRSLEDFSQSRIEACLAGYLEEAGIKFKRLAQPIRVALTGSKASPGLFEMMEVLGRAQVVARLEKALELMGR
jgi:glutamyl-tRNA synthetase